MPRIDVCPDAATLRRLLHGQLAEEQAQPLEQHLMECRTCLQAVRATPLDDTIIKAIREQPTLSDASGPEEAVRKLMERLKLLPWCGHEATAEIAAAEAQPSAEPRPLRSAPQLTQEAHGFLAPPQKPGEIGRLGPYRVLKVLGAGGMGVVFQAEDVKLKRLVALKAMRPGTAASAGAGQRFQREAETTAAIKHDHIVTIYQVGEDRGVPFLAMEFLDGESLDDRLQRENTLPLADALRISREIAEGLAAAHEHGLIHRDIKPGNLWLEGKRGRVKILDFGLARAASGDDMHLTQLGAIVGTPAYMAPEQARSEALDRRCDLFSLGCVMYRMVTGVLPFQGKDTMSMLLALAMEHPRPPRELNPRLPLALNNLILRLLAKNVADRPASALAVAKAIERIESTPVSSQISAPARDERPAAQRQAVTKRKKRMLVLAAPRRRRGVFVAAALIGLLGAAAAAAVIVIRLRTPDGKEINIEAPEGTTVTIALKKEEPKPAPSPVVPVVSPPGEKPADSRIGRVRTLDDKDFFLRVPASREAWEARRQAIREQVLVANGLWPLPDKTPLHPVIHGEIDRDDYTIEKVFFASYPGHYVSGNLYRPKGKTGKLPGVLCPYGHWANGRFYEVDEKTVADQIKQGAEKTPEGARYPLQARCAQLARMGCVVFHYDMVGRADSTAIAHASGFTDADAELRLQSFMGLQTWNSIRSLDFLLSLPEVDARRIGVTGASGGGTQTILLCAVDDRPAVAFPAVMVSTQMQGGCTCENCSYLRVGTGNIELAGLFAPKPLAMSGANDWTIDIERKGLPELKALYKLYGAEDRVLARCFPQFEHNYNQVSREVMYNWFNKHLQLGLSEPVVERPFKPVSPKELSVYDDKHPRPADTVSAERLRQYMTQESDNQIDALRPKDAGGVAEYRRVLGTALRAMMQDQLPVWDQVEEVRKGEMEKHDGFSSRRFFLTRKGQNERIPAIVLVPPEFVGAVVVWIDPRGKASLFQDGKLVPAAKQVLDRKGAILAVDVFGTGDLSLDKPSAVNPQYAGFTFGYNRTLLAQRIHDILTAVAYAKGHEKAKTVHLAGFEKAGPWVLLARGLCGDAVARTAADFDGFRFDKVRTTTDEMMLPGALKYGGLPALAALSAPSELYVHHYQGTGSEKGLEAIYQAAGAMDKLQRSSEKATNEKIVEWLIR